MKYSVGDKVQIKSLEWYNKNKDSNGNVVFSSKVTHFSWCENVRTVFTKDMVKFCGKVVTIETVWTANYSIVEGTNRDYFTDEMIEGLVEEEMSLDKAGQITDFEYEGLTYTLPEGYIFKDENGNVINATKIVLEKKKKEYPKTYKECCYVLGFENTELVFEDDYRGINPTKEQWKRLVLMNQFYQLLICRDAYWKLYGEKMGLGKPWEPDWTADDVKYTISTIEGMLTRTRTCYDNAILAFPTTEMRDAFYESFKELIKQCKELL